MCDNLQVQRTQLSVSPGSCFTQMRPSLGDSIFNIGLSSPWLVLLHAITTPGQFNIPHRSTPLTHMNYPEYRGQRTYLRYLLNYNT